MKIQKQSVYHDKPADWDILPIKKVGRVVTGTTPKTSVDEYYDGDYLFVSPGDLDNSRIVQRSSKSLTEKGFNQTRPVPKNSVLFTSIGSSIGKTSIAGCELATNQQINSVVTNERVNPNYLYNSLQYYRNYVERLAGSQAVPIINKSSFESLRLPYPPKREQDKIISVLNIWDKAATTAERLIRSKKHYKKGLIQQLLSGKTRFSEFEGDPWVEVKLENFFKYYSNKNREDEDLPILSCSKVHGITRQENIFDKRVASKDISGYKIVEKYDLVYDPMLLWDASIGFLKEVDRGVISPAYYTFKFKDGTAYRPYFEFLFGTHYMKYNYKAISQGTNTRRRKAPREAFLKIPIKLPGNIEEQKKIADTLLAAQKEIDLLKEKLELFKKQKKGLMQKLLTGKVRVNELETV